jgi:hypothetical protein
MSQRQQIGALATVIAVGLAAAISALVLASAGAKSASRNSAAATRSSADPSGSVSRILVHDFAVVRHSIAARGAASETVNNPPLPAPAASHLTDPESSLAEYGANPALAQYVTIPGVFAGWIVPGAHGMCIYMQEPAPLPGTVSVCNSDTRAAAGELQGVALTPQGTPVNFGAAPDGNVGVLVADAGGSSHAVPVVDGVYAFRDAGAQSIHIQDAAGHAKTLALGPAGQP